MFLEPTPTSYDLRWRMFGIPVRVHPMFWLVSLIMGSSVMEAGVHYLLIWVGCLFVSILIHELGHVWMGQWFGSHGHIVLYGFGGLAIGSNHLDQRWQRVLVSLAGPAAGFLFLAALFLVLWIWEPDAFPLYLVLALNDLGLPLDTLPRLGGVLQRPDPLILFIVGNLIFINLLWGLVNLLPIWPLDGGMISRDLCEAVSPRSGLTQSLGISLVVAGLLAIHCFLVVMGRQLFPLRFGSPYSALLFAVLALQSFQLLQQIQAEQRRMEDHWED
jgi:stage IV sporulation protein FB